MRPASPHLRNGLIAATILTSLAATYWSGYRAGLSEKGPQHRALVVRRRTKGNPNSSGSRITWFDIRDPSDAARLSREEARLKAIGADYYVARGRIETTLSPEPDPRKVNAHR